MMQLAFMLARPSYTADKPTMSHVSALQLLTCQAMNWNTMIDHRNT